MTTPQAKPQPQYVQVNHPYFDVPQEQLVAGNGTRSNLAGGVHLDWRQIVGGSLIGVGVVMLVVGWILISGTKNTYEQLTYFLSGGLGGTACVLIGATVLVTYEHYTDRQALSRIDDRIALLEERLAYEFSLLSGSTGKIEHVEQPAALNGTGTAKPVASVRRRA